MATERIDNLRTPIFDKGRLIARPGRNVEVPSEWAARLRGETAATGTATGDGGGGESGALAGVRFASDEAQAFAAENGLTAADFETVKPSGADGGFTKPDVRAVIEAKAK